MRIAIQLSFCILLLITFFSCKEEKVRVIKIQPLGNFSPAISKSIKDQLTLVNPNVIIAPNIALPNAAYYAPRDRYRADRLLKILSRQASGDTIIVGIMNEDISTSHRGVQDWGVLGLGQRPGKACVVSTFRVNKRERAEQMYKLLLHELGHTEGLAHCKSELCLMKDAEGKNHLGKVKAFCDNCAQYLKKKHWQLN
jgi:archaemetzincin